MYDITLLKTNLRNTVKPKNPKLCSKQANTDIQIIDIDTKVHITQLEIKSNYTKISLKPKPKYYYNKNIQDDQYSTIPKITKCQR